MVQQLRPVAAADKVLERVPDFILKNRVIYEDRLVPDFFKEIISHPTSIFIIISYDRYITVYRSGKLRCRVHRIFCQTNKK
jgi:hypothetical protein